MTTDDLTTTGDLTTEGPPAARGAATAAPRGGVWGGFGRVVAGEWGKLVTIRSTVWTLVAAVAALPVMAVFVGATGSLQPDDTVLGGSLTGAALTQMVLGALGALVVTTEYGPGTIGLTFTAVPRRAAVLAAKAVVVGAVVFPSCLVAGAMAYGAGEVMLSGDGYATGEPWPALVGVAACLTVSALVGVALGVLFRSSAGAICAVVGVMLLPTLLGPLFGDYRRWVAGASPTSTLEKLTQTSDAGPEMVGSLGAWPSLAVLAAVTSACLLGARLLLDHRDA